MEEASGEDCRRNGAYYIKAPRFQWPSQEGNSGVRSLKCLAREALLQKSEAEMSAMMEILQNLHLSEKEQRTEGPVNGNEDGMAIRNQTVPEDQEETAKFCLTCRVKAGLYDAERGLQDDPHLLLGRAKQGRKNWQLVRCDHHLQLPDEMLPVEADKTPQGRQLQVHLDYLMHLATKKKGKECLPASHLLPRPPPKEAYRPRELPKKEAGQQRKVRPGGRGEPEERAAASAATVRPQAPSQEKKEEEGVKKPVRPEPSGTSQDSILPQMPPDPLPPPQMPPNPLSPPQMPPSPLPPPQMPPDPLPPGPPPAPQMPPDPLPPPQMPPSPLPPPQMPPGPSPAPQMPPDPLPPPQMPPSPLPPPQMPPDLLPPPQMPPVPPPPQMLPVPPPAQMPPGPPPKDKVSQANIPDDSEPMEFIEQGEAEERERLKYKRAKVLKKLAIHEEVHQPLPPLLLRMLGQELRKSRQPYQTNFCRAVERGNWQQDPNPRRVWHWERSSPYDHYGAVHMTTLGSWANDNHWEPMDCS